jgi:hypothetical protein
MEFQRLLLEKRMQAKINFKLSMTYPPSVDPTTFKQYELFRFRLHPETGLREWQRVFASNKSNSVPTQWRPLRAPIKYKRLAFNPDALEVPSPLLVQVLEYKTKEDVKPCATLGAARFTLEQLMKAVDDGVKAQKDPTRWDSVDQFQLVNDDMLLSDPKNYQNSGAFRIVPVSYSTL